MTIIIISTEILILWARPPRASESQTHLAPPAGVGCCGGNRRPTSGGQAPSPPRAPQGHHSKKTTPAIYTIQFRIFAGERRCLL